MPIIATADHDREVVFTLFTGKISLQDLEEYHLNFWVSNTLYGYNELMDFGDADFSAISYGDLLTLSQISSQLYRFEPGSKLAIFTHNKEHINIADFFIAACSITTGRSRETRSFIDIDHAANWLAVPEKVY